MKKVLFITIFCISRLIGQVGPPDLRCLEVLPNGHVKLTWLPPADPANLFSTYEIHFSLTKIGPFIQLATGITNTATVTFVHTSTTAAIQPVYYFMVTRFGSGGSSASIHSDTLRTIFFNAIASLNTLDLSFSPLHIPKLPSTGNMFTVLKEYPIGTWSTLAITSSTVYPDTINICESKLTYQATLPDNSGCVSASNLIVGTYKNSKDPEMPYVDSTSVLPNGTTVLAWKIPIDKDIDRYQIQYKANVTVTIDVVPGRNSTFYTYTATTANFDTVQLSVRALDSCGRGSTVFYDNATMFLKTKYDNCNYSTALSWNHYVWPEVNNVTMDELFEYRIYYSINGAAFSLIGSTKNNSFVHDDVAPGKNICYFVRAVNRTKTVTSSSNRSCFFSDQIAAPSFVYITTASIINDKSALIKILLDTSIASTGIEIQRSDDGIQFKKIGYVAYDGNPHYSVMDETIESQKQSYYYRAIIIDSCGNSRGSSNKVKTILLKVQDDSENLFTKYLSWSDYIGFNGGVSGYKIYRMVNNVFTGNYIATTDPSTTTYKDELEDAAPEGAKVEYLVEAIEGIGNSYGILEGSSSNIVSVYMEGRLFVPNAFAPKGVNRTWKPITHFIDKTDYRVSVFDRWGHRVFETTDDSKAWDGENCKPDVYVYLINYKNARGEYLELKGTVLLME